MRIVAPIIISTAAGTLQSTNVDTSADPAAWAAGTYALGDRRTHQDYIWESVEAANTQEPGTGDKWAQVEPTNQLAMFDRRIGTQTVFEDGIVVEVEPGEVVDTVSFRNVDASTITLEQEDPVAGVVYPAQTQNMVEPVGDWWEYLYYPIVRKTEAIFTGLLPYRNAVITATIAAPGGDAKCGLMTVGLAYEPGDAQDGASDGIEDYSVIRPDQFGIRDIVERDYSDDAELTVWVPWAESARFRRVLTERRAQPTLVVLADNLPHTQYYGLISFRRIFQYYGMDVFNLTVKGFT